MMTTLEAARDALAAIDGVSTCKVGLEANISPSSYPLIRVVPSRITPGKPYANRTAETLIYFGTPTTNSEGLESVYDNLLTMEADIIAVLRTLQGRYVETITDEDRLPLYKMMVVRCELSGVDVPVRCVMLCASSVETLDDTATVLSPFTSTTLESEAADWTPDLAAGSVTRLLNGAGATRTRITVAGTVSGPVDTLLLLGIYKDGALMGNRTAVLCTGSAVAFSLQQTASATASAVFTVKASGPAVVLPDLPGDYTFSDVTMTAERF